RGRHASRLLLKFAATSAEAPAPTRQMHSLTSSIGPAAGVVLVMERRAHGGRPAGSRPRVADSRRRLGHGYIPRAAGEVRGSLLGRGDTGMGAGPGRSLSAHG